MTKLQQVFQDINIDDPVKVDFQQNSDKEESFKIFLVQSMYINLFISLICNTKTLKTSFLLNSFVYIGYQNFFSYNGFNKVIIL